MAEQHHDGNLYRERGKVRTNLQCTNCDKGFIAEIDFGLDGQHIIHCPWCKHPHYRTIRDGICTEDRWGTGQDGQRIHKGARVWRHDKAEIQTSSASWFLRERWKDKLG